MPSKLFPFAEYWWFYALFGCLILLLLLMDLLAHRNARPISMRAAARWTGLWILLGTGFSGVPRGVVAEAIRWIRAQSAGNRVVAIDLPSGLDADTGEAELAVAIRTFWLDGDEVRFGTGAGITWGSDPDAEWRETELKAERLVKVASGTWQAGSP